MLTKTITEEQLLRRKQKMLCIKAIERIKSAQPKYTVWEYAMQTLAALFLLAM
jgi:hypothetical protein